MLTRRAKAYNISCSQIALVYFQPFRRNSLLKCAAHAAEDCNNKSTKPLIFRSSRSFKVVDVDTTKKLVTRACCDRQHIHAYLQPFSR